MSFSTAAVSHFLSKSYPNNKIWLQMNYYFEILSCYFFMFFIRLLPKQPQRSCCEFPKHVDKASVWIITFTVTLEKPSNNIKHGENSETEDIRLRTGVLGDENSGPTGARNEVI